MIVADISVTARDTQCPWAVCSEQVVARHGDSFVLLSARGELVGRFAPSSFSDEDDRWRTAQRVVGTELQERTTIDRRSGEARVYEEKVLLRGLQPVDDEATRRLVAGALAAVESASARAQAERDFAVSELQLCATRV